MEKSNKPKKSLAFKIIMSIIIALLLIFLIAIIYIIAKVNGLGESMHKPLTRDKSELRNSKVNTDGTPISIALFGIDTDKVRKAEGGGERSDSIILLSINPDKKKTVMVSIPRDTRAKIVGRGPVEKINHAYAYGGPEMSIKSIENLMNVPIDHYATINMDGIQELIDEVGGIDAKSNATFSYKGYDFKEGKTYHMNGKEARTFITSRKQDGAGGDFGRQARQQLVLQSLANKLISINSLPKINKIFDTLGDNVSTDLSITQMNELRTKYEPATKHTEKLQLQGQNEILDDGLYYFLPNKANKEKIEKEYRKNLGI